MLTPEESQTVAFAIRYMAANIQDVEEFFTNDQGEIDCPYIIDHDRLQELLEKILSENEDNS